MIRSQIAFAKYPNNLKGKKRNVHSKKACRFSDGLLDETVGPDQPHQSFVFFQRLPMVLDQHQEDVESPGRQGDDLLVSDQQAFLCV
jgi:hypothetical protein